MRARTACFVLGVLLVPSGARADEGTGYQTRRELTLRTRDIFRRYCAECHTGAAELGQSKLKLMDHAQVVGKKRPIPLAAPDGRALLLDLVKDGSMPPANRPGPSAEEVAVLERWVRAGAPAYPAAFDEQYVLKTIADDLNRPREDARALLGRYVSLAHLVRPGDQTRALVAAVESEEAALHGALRPGADPKADPVLVPIDPAATVFRLDVSRLNWLANTPWTQIDAGKPAGAFRLTPLDLLLLEYPFAGAVEPKGPLARLFADQIRPVAFLRGDWLRGALREGQQPSPLATDMAALVLLAPPGGTDQNGPIAKPFAGAKPLVVRPNTNGRLPIAPLSAWYSGDIAPEKPPFALEADVVSGGKVVTQVKIDDEFTLRVSCDKKVFFTLLQVQADGEVRVQKVQGGTVLLANRERHLSPNGVSFSIGGITTGTDMAVEHFVLLASETELPLPTIVRSGHAGKYLWRFVLEPTEKHPFDPNAVVRKVVPVKVTRK
ncbi:MAG TPA: hypothetical protein VGE74_00675 [Gemmata sp.]